MANLRTALDKKVTATTDNDATAYPARQRQLIGATTTPTIVMTMATKATASVKETMSQTTVVTIFTSKPEATAFAVGAWTVASLRIGPIPLRN